ncbi:MULTISPECIES: hypothetical protein [unclassified Streptomyces]|uniref:hypothetical protein n=1 Tax=unclassified Streptomyces TaxID=2593676 RepID=UPI003447951A
MAGRQEEEYYADEHYEECPAPDEQCRCGAITAEAEAYYAEPSNMFEMEWGCY